MTRRTIQPSPTAFAQLLAAHEARDVRAVDDAVRALSRRMDAERGELAVDLRGPQRCAQMLAALMWAAQKCPDRCDEIGLILGAMRPIDA